MHGTRNPAERSRRQALPRHYRGRQGALALVKDVPLRVAVTGVDGTFELTRLVHEALVRRRRRVVAHAGLDDLPRAGLRGLGRSRTPEARLLRHAKRCWPFDALVVESPAVGEDGLAFNAGVAQAQAVLLTSIAHDPHDGSLRADLARAKAIAQAVPPKATVVSGESDPAMKAALRDAVREAGAFFLDAAPRVHPHAPPGLELVTVLDRFLRIRTGGGLASAEKVRLLARMERRLQWTPSALPGVRWHDGTTLAAPAVRRVLDHLLRRWPARLYALAYYGEGKAHEAERAVPMLERAFTDGLLAHAYVAGPGSRPIVRALSSSQPVSVFGHRTSALPGLFRILRSECRSGAIVTLGDGGAPWMRQAVERLRQPDLPRGRWAPWGAQASELPAAIALPAARPPAPAPGIGRRAKANILGDLDPALAPRPGPGLLPDQGWQAPAARPPTPAP